MFLYYEKMRDLFGRITVKNRGRVIINLSLIVEHRKAPDLRQQAAQGLRRAGAACGGSLLLTGYSCLRLLLLGSQWGCKGVDRGVIFEPTPARRVHYLFCAHDALGGEACRRGGDVVVGIDCVGLASLSQDDTSPMTREAGCGR